MLYAQILYEFFSGIYKLALTHNKLGISKEVMATRIIPFLVPLSIENGLTITQFNSIMAMIKDMLHRVETEHRTKIEQLNSIKNESHDFDLRSKENPAPLVLSGKSPTTEIEASFSNLHFDNNFGTTAPEFSASSILGSSSKLSLADKQRFVAQQEMCQRMQAQSPIIPVAISMKTPTKPKDLTSTLIESNLNQMKSSTSWQATKNATGSSNYNNLQSPTNVWQPTHTRKTEVTPPTNLQSLNIIAFPLNETTKKLPMNQMQSATQIQPRMINTIMDSNFNNESQGTKMLSQDDIMDLLS